MKSLRKNKKNKKAKALNGPVEDALDKTSAVQTIDESEVLWDNFSRYYAENERTIRRASQLDIVKGARNPKELKREMEAATFLENSKTILQGLQFLSGLHPTLGLAVGAFAAVINLELVRRDTNTKVMSVMVQMQNMMCALFHTRLLRKGQLDPAFLQDLGNLMSSISTEIEACGSALNYYQDRSLLSRIVQATAFAQCFAEHIATFAERRADLDLLLTTYTAGRVIETADMVSRIEGKTDALVDLFHHLNTSQEKEVNKFIKMQGSIDKCIGDMQILSELMSKTNYPMQRRVTDDGSWDEENVEKLMLQLQKERAEGVEQVKEALKNNLSAFKAMLQIQKNNLQHHMSTLTESQTTQIARMLNEIALMFPGTRKYVLVTDPVLQKIWAEMGLRQSVKVEKFVLTFRDYHAQRQPKAPVMLVAPDGKKIVEVPPSSAHLEEPSSWKKQSMSIGGSGSTEEPHAVEDDSEWALGYIDVVHLDTIVDAIDEDFSGYLSINEVNSFAIGRPRNWSILRWFAYWGAGWALSIEKYKTRILDTVQEMFNAYTNVLPCNQWWVGEYLDGDHFGALDNLLRSTRPLVEDFDRKDSRLAKLVADLDNNYEELLLSNLTSLDYGLINEDKVELITGNRRIEHCAFPLLSLVLKRHLQIIRMASEYRLTYSEMAGCSKHLIAVVSLLSQRADKLEATFRRKSVGGAQEALAKYCFGMFGLMRSAEIVEHRTKDFALLASIPDHFSDTSSESGSEDWDSDDDDDDDDDEDDASDEYDDEFEGRYGTRGESEDGSDREDGIDGQDIHFDLDEGSEGEHDDESEREGRDCGDDRRDPEEEDAQNAFENHEIDGTKLHVLDRERNYDDDQSTNNDPTEVQPSEPSPFPSLVLRKAEHDARKAMGIVLNPEDDSPLDYSEQVLANNTSIVKMLGSRSLAGTWTGRFYNDWSNTGVDRPELAILEFDASSSTGTELRGRGETWTGIAELIGSITRRPPSTEWEENVSLEEPDELGEVLSIDFTYSRYFGFICHVRATVDEENPDRWTGEWYPEQPNYPHENKPRRFELLRAPPEALRSYPPIVLESHSGTDLLTEMQTEGPDGDDQGIDKSLDSPEGAEAATHAEELDNPEPPIQDLPETTEPLVNRGASLWKLATRAVLYQVRQRLHARSFYEERAKERRRWIFLSLQYDFGVATDSERDEFLTLRQNIHPNVASLWESVVIFYSSRLVHEAKSSSTWCDSCFNSIDLVRYTCIVCSPDTGNANSQIDLCFECVNEDTTTKTEIFTHKCSSHPMIKCQRRILLMEQMHQVDQARRLAKRLIAKFTGKRAAGDKSHRRQAKDAKTIEKDIWRKTCNLCAREVHLPCWVCMICRENVFFCLDCETKHTHDERHHLLRLVDNTEGEGNSVADQAAERHLEVKKMLSDEMIVVNGRIDSLAERVEGALTQRMDAMEGRLASLEGLLNRVLLAVEAQT